MFLQHNQERVICYRQQFHLFRQKCTKNEEHGVFRSPESDGNIPETLFCFPFAVSPIQETSKWGAYRTTVPIYQPRGYSHSNLINQLSDLHLVSCDFSFKREFTHWNQNTPWSKDKMFVCAHKDENQPLQPKWSQKHGNHKVPKGGKYTIYQSCVMFWLRCCMLWQRLLPWLDTDTLWLRQFFRCSWTANKSTKGWSHLTFLLSTPLHTFLWPWVSITPQTVKKAHYIIVKINRQFYPRNGKQLADVINSPSPHSYKVSNLLIF